ncbi:uncharacterized protein METZ01_LOCUS255453 [marine metagenome]|uniref:Uncharacterized protein n=1 Tax=marine metagenome TaxID=408172 RepID=A0A382ITK0_9ZZZZ
MSGLINLIWPINLAKILFLVVLFSTMLAVNRIQMGNTWFDSVAVG